MRLGVEDFALLQRVPQTAIAHNDGVDDAVFVEGKLILAQNAEFLGARHGALGGIDLAREDLHESGLTGAVGAGDGVAPSGEKGGGDVLEEDSRTEAHSDVVYAEHSSSLYREMKDGAGETSG